MSDHGHRVRVLIACPGLGYSLRGFERVARDTFEALTGNPEIDVWLAAVDEETLRRMQAVTSETCRLEGPCAPQHVGDLAWMRFQHRGREQEWRVRLWQRNGEDVAWAWLWHSDSKLFWCLKPDLRESLVGEVLDVDGRLGGFNFQWAWSSGHVAGTALGPGRRGSSIHPRVIE